MGYARGGETQGGGETGDDGIREGRGTQWEGRGDMRVGEGKGDCDTTGSQRE